MHRPASLLTLLAVLLCTLAAPSPSLADRITPLALTYKFAAPDAGFVRPPSP